MKTKKRQPTRDEMFAAFDDIGDTVRWRSSGSGRPLNREVRGVDGRGYLTVTLRGCQINVHRVLWIMRNGPIPAGAQIDHIDGDQLNNRPENLRLAIGPQNNWNRRLNRNNTSGYKGVCWLYRQGKWQAQHLFNRKVIHVGTFDTAEEAAEAISVSRQRLHGEFACDG